MDDALAAILDDAIARGWCSGAAVAVGDAGREVLSLTTGTTRTVPTPGAPVAPLTAFDLASVTKVMSTAAIAMALIGRGRLALATPAGTLVPGLDPRVTIAHLLGHGSGLPAHHKFFERVLAGDLAGQPDARRAVVHMAATTPPAHAPGELVIYSDLGYLALGAALERAGGAPLEALFADLVAGPLGLTHARFVDLRAPRPARAPWPAGVVATELDGYRGLVEGEVHDDNCHAAGGIAGHAGLFATIGEVSAFGRAAAALLAGHDTAGLPADVAIAFARAAAAPGHTRRLGWDTPSSEPGVSHAGDRWPRDGAFGHLGYTGTSLWLDVPRQRWVALLTNRVHPSRDGARAEAIKHLRRAVMDAVVEGLG